MEFLVNLALILVWSLVFISGIFVYNKKQNKETSIYLAWLELTMNVVLIVVFLILATTFSTSFTLPLILTTTLIPLYIHRLKLYFK